MTSIQVTLPWTLKSLASTQLPGFTSSGREKTVDVKASDGGHFYSHSELDSEWQRLEVALPLSSKLSHSEAPYGHRGPSVLCPAHPDDRRLSRVLETELVLLTLLYLL